MSAWVQLQGTRIRVLVFSDGPRMLGRRRVSRYGLVAYSSSLDVIGPLAQSVEDCAFVLQAIAGADAKDATSSPEQVRHQALGSKPSTTRQVS